MCNYACKDYAVLYEIISLDYWSYMYKQSPTGSACNELNSLVMDSLNQAIPYLCSRMSKFPCGFLVL
jgi:hypothetical protein